MDLPCSSSRPVAAVSRLRSNHDDVSTNRKACLVRLHGCSVVVLRCQGDRSVEAFLFFPAGARPPAARCSLFLLTSSQQQQRAAKSRVRHVQPPGLVFSPTRVVCVVAHPLPRGTRKLSPSGLVPPSTADLALTRPIDAAPSAATQLTAHCGSEGLPRCGAPVLPCGRELCAWIKSWAAICMQATRSGCDSEKLPATLLSGTASG